jgi:putative DNA primase/helicase
VGVGRRQHENSCRPVIIVQGGGLSREASEGERALLQSGFPVYQRGSVLVRPVSDEVEAADGRRTTVARLVRIGLAYMRDLLCRAALWRRLDQRRGAEVAVNPPAEVAQVILHRQGEWRFPPVAGVITTPTMRPDGSLLLTAGYDAATQLILIDPPPMPFIPMSPRRNDALAALALLACLLEEFPFADEASLSVALSALITPVVRAAFPVAPMHVVSAPEAGSGKSYLVDLVAAIAIGQPCPVIASGRIEEETEKRLGAALLSGQPLISIDNLNGDLGGDALCQAVERPVVEIRILGKSELARIEARSTLFATGNNIRLLGDLTRRVLRCRLDAKLERPECQVFRRRPVPAVLADRGRYVAAALTVARAYAATGKPQRASPLSSFEGWSDLVRSALLWLGRADPVETMRVAREEDPDRAAATALFEAWREAIGTGQDRTAAEIIALAGSRTDAGPGEREPSTEWRFRDLRESLLAVAGKQDMLDAHELGKWLSRHRDRVVNGLRLEGRSDRHGHAARWQLVECRRSAKFAASVSSIGRRIAP